MRINRGVSTGSPARPPIAFLETTGDRDGQEFGGAALRHVANILREANEPSWLLASATVGNLERLLGGLVGSDQADRRVNCECAVYVDSGRGWASVDCQNSLQAG